MKKEIKIQINGVEIKALEGMTIMEAARENNITIPSLCYLKDISQIGACRICIVDIKGVRGLQSSCTYPAENGMEILTNSEKVRKVRRGVLELILSNHPQDCLKCSRNLNCELQKLSNELGVKDIRFPGEISYDRYKEIKGLKAVAIERNPDKCILCRRCVSVCSETQGVGILAAINRGFDTIITTAFDSQMEHINCTLCGQCINVCPVEAIQEKSEIERVFSAINNKNIHVVVQTAPSVRATLGELFGKPIGTNVKGKMVAALRMLGFDKVFDTDFTADLTIIEEGYEFIDRLKKNKQLPLITSCSPGWIKYCEHHYPEFINNLSTCKSPQQMFGALVKTYYSELSGIKPENIFSVSIMPCTAKKYEAKRSEINSGEASDVDAVLTVREFGQMIKEAGIDFNALDDEEFDLPMGESSGAGVIFGTTGGVMEAALRTVSEVVTGESLEKIEFYNVRGISKGLKESEIEIGDYKIKVAVVHGLQNAKVLLEKIKNGEEYHFVEIMACSGGCIGGGGTPIVDAQARSRLKESYLLTRAKAIYDEDCIMQIRQSHKNPAVLKLYQEFLGEPNGKRAHELLHTRYIARKKYPDMNTSDERQEK